MIKKLSAIILVVLMLMSMSAIAVSAAEVNEAVGADTSSEATGAGQLIYFDASGWKNVNQIYCHIWVNGGDDFYGWKASGEKCTKVSGSLWSYDLSALNNSTNVSGGFKSGEDYCVIFCADTGAQTYDATIGTACIGDRMKITGKMIENPMDSEKEGYEAVWSKNSSKFGPHFAISSIGNFIGEFLCPNEKKLEIIGNWLVKYSGSMYCDAVEVLEKSFKKFNISQEDVGTIYDYISTKNSLYDLATMKNQLETAYKNLHPEEKVTTPTTSPTDPKTGKKINPTDPKTGEEVIPIPTSGYYDSRNEIKDGESHTVLLISGFVMLLAAGIFVSTRKKSEF